MGLDKDDDTPPVDFSRRTTKVNVWMIVGLLAFFVITGAVVWALWPSPATHDTSPPMTR